MLVAKKLNKKYEIKQKTKKWSFGTLMTKEAVYDISLKIEKGTIVGLLGMNGAGKTTTIKMLTTMIEPTSGEITIDNIDAIKDPIAAKKIINLITGGERNIYWRLTGKENLQYFGRLYGINESELNKRIDEILKIVELYEVKDVSVEKYSKGMKQRLQIARGLINDPKYIFLDEPTLGLDIVIAKELRQYIRKLASEKDKGILLTTHYISEADELCDYIYVIHRGKIISEDKPHEIKSKYTSQYKSKFEVDNLSIELKDDLMSLNKEENIKVIIDEESNSFEALAANDITAHIINLIENNGGKVLKVFVLEPTLEGALLNMIGEY